MALRGQVVDFVQLNLLDDAHQAAGIRHVAVMQDELAVGLVRVLVQMVDAVGVEQRATALDAMHHIILVEQEFGKVSAILAGDAGNQGNFLLSHGVLRVILNSAVIHHQGHQEHQERQKSCVGQFPWCSWCPWW